MPGLGEERFPVFVGVPLIGAGTVIGVLVLQRRTTKFAADEVTLATALGAPVTSRSSGGSRVPFAPRGSPASRTSPAPCSVVRAWCPPPPPSAHRPSRSSAPSPASARTSAAR
ncbi:MAG: hypothetical protein IPQ07_32950 [Myxococcales bacterium]|nr:hypothetical protein [Myxococcales bacterium]